MGSVEDVMWADARHADLHTACRRGGVAARIYPANILAINGNDSCNGVQGQCGCQHAEVTAILRGLVQGVGPPGWHRTNALWCTLSPCTTCARAIIESKLIDKVLYLREYRDLRGIRILRDNGIETRKVSAQDVT